MDLYLSCEPSPEIDASNSATAVIGLPNPLTDENGNVLTDENGNPISPNALP